MSVILKKKGFEPHEQNMTKFYKGTGIPLAFIIFDLYNSKKIQVGMNYPHFIGEERVADLPNTPVNKSKVRADLEL